MSNLSAYENKFFSQNGEDGITIEIINRLYENSTKKFYVEFGTENASECNTRILRERYNWKGLLMDGSHENAEINLQKEFITKENIISLFQKYNVPNKFELLSIDIDFNDFYVLHEIIKSYSMDIIIAEYNSTHLPNEDKVIQYNANGGWDGTNYFSASLLAFTNLLNKYNYSLVYTDTKGVNAFFINNNILEKHIEKFNLINDINALYNSPKYNNGPRGGHPHDVLDRQYISSNDAMTI